MIAFKYEVKSGQGQLVSDMWLVGKGRLITTDM